MSTVALATFPFLLSIGFAVAVIHIFRAPAVDSDQPEEEQ